MVKGSAFILLFVLAALALSFLHLTSYASSVSVNDHVMEVQGILFAFGWSANSGEKWLVNGELVILNIKALVIPSSVPIEGDAGSPQTNPNIIYTNNIGFNFGWSVNASERYRPSNSMTVGAAQALNNKGLLEPPHAPIYENAGPTQTNPSIIYFNNIGFHYSWSQNTAERYRPSDSMTTGPLLAFNSKGLITPPTTPISEDAGTLQTNPSFIYLNNIGFHFAWSPVTQDKYRPSTSMTTGPLSNLNSRALVIPTIPEDASPAQNNPSVIYLNNIGFHYGWSPNSEDKYRPSSTIGTGTLTTLNTKALTVPTWDAVGDITPPIINAPVREPAGNPTPEQSVTVSVNVTDNESGVNYVILSYNINSTSTWINITMNTVATNLYQETIPPQRYGTNVTYKIIAYNNYGYFATTTGEPYEVFNYNVIPEFSSTTILTLFLILIAIIALTAKMRASKHFIRIVRFGSRRTRESREI